MTEDSRPEGDVPETDRPEMAGPADDAIEAEAATESAALDTLQQASGHAPVKVEREVEDETEAEAGPPAQQERLQKILAQAGVASRRHAEELITQGRVQVNGAVVTALGTKADPNRDHVRVDGKLLRGAERLRYFVLNKPKGFVTTVSDPEGRPTVMQFFEKMRERLYPVGRLDYLSEGLLLVTNDGELANKLTKAASGVEKTYLVKVSGQPSEEDLDRLREGVAIDRGRPGSGQVHTAPARIRLMRHADNPWYEVVLTEGRNRELRKMFEEIGHHVEKIRRVGYGPLVLDLEPGKMRELDPDEVEDLRKAAEGKLRPKKAKETRRASKAEAQLPPARPRRERGWQERPPKRAGFGRSGRGESGFQQREERSETRAATPKSRFGGERPERPERPTRPADERGRGGDRRESAGQARFGGGRRFKNRGEDQGQARRSGPGRERQAFSGQRRAEAERSFGAKPVWKKSGERPPVNRADAGRNDSDSGGFKRPRAPRLRIDEISHDGMGAERGAPESRPKKHPGADRASGRRGGFEPGRSERPRFDRPRFDQPDAQRTGGYRREGGGAPSGRDARRSSAPRPAGKSGGWKPKTNFGGQGRTESGERPERGSRPSFGSSSRPKQGKASWGDARPPRPKRGDAGPRTGSSASSGRSKFGRAKYGGRGGERGRGGSGGRGRT